MNPGVAIAGIVVGALTVAALIVIGTPPLLALLAYPFSGAAAILLVAFAKFSCTGEGRLRRSGRARSSQGGAGLALRLFAALRRH